VHFTSSDGHAVLPADMTLTNGIGTFSETLDTSGSQTITAADTASPAITGTSNADVVAPGAATHFSVGIPANGTAGTPGSVTVTALDPLGNVVTGCAGTVHFTSSDGQAVLPADVTLTNGTGSFGETLDTSGNQTITATDTVSAGINGTSNTEVVAPGTATHFSVSIPAIGRADNPGSVTVTALDAHGNVATDYTGTVHFTSTDGSAVLPANMTLINGVGTFSETFETTGNQTITATDAVSAGITGTSNTETVGPADAAPVVTAGHIFTYTEGQGATPFDAALTVTDADSTDLAHATVQISGHYVQGEDVLAFPTQNGITGSFDAITGTETLTGSATPAQYEAALRSVTYLDNSQNPSALDRTVTIVANDGTVDSTPVTDTIHVLSVDNPPVVTVGTITNFSEPPNGTPAANSAPVTIAPNLTISDVDSTDLTSATFVLNDLKPSDALSVSGHAGSSGTIGGIDFAITSTATTETVTFTGTDTLAHYASALDLVQFNNTSENPDTTARSYTITAVDDGTTANGGNPSGSATATQTVTAVDDAPVAVADGSTVAPIVVSSGTLTSYNLLSNDTDVDTPLANLTAVKNTDGAHGTVVLNAGGTFTYTANAGFLGTDSFTYHANDGTLSSNVATVTVEIQPNVAYIAYTTIAAFNTANTAANHYDIAYVEQGTGSYSSATGIVLLAGQTLEGQGVDPSYVNQGTGQTVVLHDLDNTSSPTITVTGGATAVTLNTNNTIEGLNIAGTGFVNGIADSGGSVGSFSLQGVGISTVNGNGLSLTHGGTFTATPTTTTPTDSNVYTNTINTTGTGTALDVTLANIGSGNITFQSISANGGTNGIVLNNTGSSGGLHVTGTGAAGSGGTIQHESGADIVSVDPGTHVATVSGTGGTGIFLQSTVDTELNHLQLNDFSNNAIFGNNVTGFQLANSTINGTNGNNGGTTAGNGTSDPESSIQFYNLHTSGADPTASITNSSISGGAAGNVWVSNTNGTLDRLVMTGNTIGFDAQNAAQSHNVSRSSPTTAARSSTPRSAATVWARGTRSPAPMATCSRPWPIRARRWTSWCVTMCSRMAKRSFPTAAVSTSAVAAPARRRTSRSTSRTITGPGRPIVRAARRRPRSSSLTTRPPP
jgi:VCBS repeat-containing protein